MQENFLVGWEPYLGFLLSCEGQEQGGNVHGAWSYSHLSFLGVGLRRVLVLFFGNPSIMSTNRASDFFFFFFTRKIILFSSTSSIVSPASHLLVLLPWCLLSGKSIFSRPVVLQYPMSMEVVGKNSCSPSGIGYCRSPSACAGRQSWCAEPLPALPIRGDEEKNCPRLRIFGAAWKHCVYNRKQRVRRLLLLNNLFALKLLKSLTRRSDHFYFSLCRECIKLFHLSSSSNPSSCRAGSRGSAVCNWGLNRWSFEIPSSPSNSVILWLMSQGQQAAAAWGRHARWGGCNARSQPFPRRGEFKMLGLLLSVHKPFCSSTKRPQAGFVSSLRLSGCPGRAFISFGVFKC